jgi:hypothetical protein
MILAFGACSMLDQGGADERPFVEPELSQTKAPENTDFRSVREVSVELDVTQRDAARVYLKITEPKVGQLFLGRVEPGSLVTLALSVPRTSSEIVYEFYDETGWREEGLIVLE